MWTVDALLAHFDDGECWEDIAGNFDWWDRVGELESSIRDDDPWGDWKCAQIEAATQRHLRRLDDALPPDVCLNLEVMKARTKVRNLAALVDTHKAGFGRVAEAAMEVAAACFLL